MSEGGRPRRSAAAQNKVWASLMPNRSGGDEDVYDDVPEPTRKRGASKETPGKSPGEDIPSAVRIRGKKVKLSDSTIEDPLIHEEQPLVAEPEPNIAITSPRSMPRSPKKATPQAKKSPMVITTSDAADLQRMQEEFDRHNTTAPLDEELEEEELVPPPIVTKPAPKPRGRQMNRPNAPPTLTGMDDPKDADYSDEQEKKRPSPPKPKAPSTMPAPRTIVMKAPNVPRPVYRAPVPIPRVIYPNRLPTVINGGPRVVQPRYSRPPSNSDLMTKPLPVHTYDTPQNVLADIDRLSKNLKDNGDPTVTGVFELVQIMRDEMERSQKALSEATQFYQEYIERFQGLFATNDEEYQKRVRNLEQRISHLEGQLKKASAIAHQKLLKGREEGPHSQKLIPQQYVVVGEPGSIEQSHPTNYLVQEEEYTTVGPQSTYYHHEAVIQEASKEVDNML
ncbi:hypothetical protein FO519_000815 [Halicephalobus sp. NKZ332]|nr:hypothetical protein FO519_000815 [Halicephalobus sp. NKZ332]